MTALRQATGGRARFTGVGGPRMAAAGLQSLFPYDRLSVMGLVEVVRHLPRLLGDIHRAARAARAARPAAVITIDSPDFSFRVARRLQGAGIPLVHYVAPSVWAWRPGRARKVAKLYDLLLCLLPFEPPWFTPHGLDARFVGHSVVEPDENQVTGEAVPRAPWPAASVTRLCLLPGSRTGEVRRLLPVFRQAVDLLARRRTLDVVVPTVPTVAALVRQGTADWSVPVRVVEDIAAHGPAMAQCD
ncbi:MAG: lipid-A-disaccharide synthase, partial [Alphaproteobacteria bacterium]